MGIFVNSKHNLLILIAMSVVFLIPIVGLFGLLAWAMMGDGYGRGGFGIQDISRDVPIGSAAVVRDFAGYDVSGTQVSLSDFHGSVVMIDFWSSWCGPCVAEASLLEMVYDEYKDKGIEFIGIAIWDNQADIIDHINTFGVSYTNLVDDKGTIAIDYGVSGIPEKIFISRDGVIKKRFSGSISQEELRHTLDNLLEFEKSNVG